jgi:hypothetical protein
MSILISGRSKGFVAPGWLLVDMRERECKQDERTQVGGNAEGTRGKKEEDRR